MNKLLLYILLSLAFTVQLAMAEAPVVFSGPTVKWIPAALKSAGLCVLSSTGVQTSAPATLSNSAHVTGVLPNANTTAASANTLSAIVARDGAGAFSAGAITASLVGNASTATALASNPADCSVGQFATAIAANGDLTCAAAGAGDVTGPAGATDNAITVFDGATGKLLKNSAILISGSKITGLGTCTASGDACDKAYIDAAIVGDVPAKDAVNFATTAALATVTYSNGASGVGATLTAVALGALSLDGQSPSIGQTVLVKNQASTFQNGPYTVTVAGSAGLAFVLTRRTDYDQAVEALAGSSIFVITGTTNGSTVWDQNSANVATMGTDAITFVQTGGPGSTTIGALDANAANAQGLSFNGSVLSAQSADATHPGMVNTTTQTFAGQKTFSTGVTATVTGNASTATALAANPADCGAGTKATTIAANGDLTCSAVSLTADVSGTLPVANGGTGAATLTIHGVVIGNTASAVNVTSAGTAGQVLTSNGAALDPTFQASAAAAAADSVLTKTTSYTVVTGDFNANKKLMVECNCTADCNITFPAASNTGFELDLINIGSATCTGVLAGSDTYGSTTDTTWILPAGGNPQSSNIFKASGGTRWNGF